MTKIKNLLSLLLFAIGLSGCNASLSSSRVPNDGLTTLFLVDEVGNSYANIPYICDSMSSWDFTAYNGEFSFYPSDNCRFDFTGLNGTSFSSPIIDDVVYIVDDLDRGKNGIPYECSSFIGIDYTYNDGVNNGSFDYAPNDSCLFYL